jgi:hypothetical protein
MSFRNLFVLLSCTAVWLLLCWLLPRRRLPWLCASASGQPCRSMTFTFGGWWRGAKGKEGALGRPETQFVGALY